VGAEFEVDYGEERGVIKRFPLSAEVVGHFKESVVDSGIGYGRVRVGEVLDLIFEADGAGLGLEVLEACSELEGEVECACGVEWNFVR
jgi:hypothetical protein